MRTCARERKRGTSVISACARDPFIIVVSRVKSSSPAPSSLPPAMSRCPTISGTVLLMDKNRPTTCPLISCASRSHASPVPRQRRDEETSWPDRLCPISARMISADCKHGMQFLPTTWERANQECSSRSTTPTKSSRIRKMQVGEVVAGQSQESEDTLLIDDKRTGLKTRVN
jgi:hypothetical protein